MKYAEAEKSFSNFKNFLRRKLGLSPRKEMKADEEIRTKFATLSPDDKMKIISPQLALYTSALSNKSQVLPVISTIAATLVVVATLNQSLVPLSLVETKSILSIFLLLIPTTLYYYIKTMEQTAKNAIKVIESYQSEGIFKKLGEATFVEQFKSDFPIGIVYLFYGIIFFILIRMWFS